MASQAKARREDKNKSIAQQIQEFSNDSVVFFNKCAKPDKNGKSSSLLSLLRSCMKSFPLIYIGHLPFLNRVHENSAGLRYGLHRDWLHRVHYQAGLHSN